MYSSCGSGMKQQGTNIKLSIFEIHFSGLNQITNIGLRHIAGALPRLLTLSEVLLSFER